MLPILLVLGATGALLEFKRLASRPPRDGDVSRLQQSEERLKRVLQEVQRELQQEKSAHQTDSSRADELEKIAAELRAAQAELVRKSRAMEDRANGLSAENVDLRKKVERLEGLEGQHAEDLRRNTEKFEAELEGLKRELASAFEAFTDGSITAEGLLDKFTELGVEVELTADDLRALPSANGDDGAPVRQVELQVDSQWRSHLRLLSDDPERMARQLAESAHRAALPAPGAAGGFPCVRTPPRDRQESSIFSGVPAIALAAFTPRLGEKENRGESPKRLAADAEKQPLRANRQRHEDAGSPSPVLVKPSAPAASIKKPPTPTRKKPPTVPRLGLSVVLRGDQKREASPAFALADLCISDDDSSRSGFSQSLVRS